MATAAATRKRMDDLLARAAPATRYLDLCMVLRRPLAHFTAAVKRGQRLTATGSGGAVELRVLADAQPGQPVPVASVVPGKSASVPDDAELRAKGGAVVGVLRGEELLRAGGRWDFLRRAWAPEAPAAPLVVDVQESQVDVTRWYARWLARFAARAADPSLADVHALDLDFAAALVYGGRRGGKTFLLVLLTWALCLATPRHVLGETVGWLVSVANTERQEIDRQIKEVIPPAWYSYREWPTHQYTLRHGSTLTNVSADNPETVKRGRGDIVLLNEGAKMPQLVFDNAVGGTGDTGGLILIASNPPTKQKGAWIRDIVEQAREDAALGKTYPIKVFKLDHKANAAISEAGRGRVGEILQRLNPRMAAADDLGDVLHIGDAIMYRYDRVRHGISAPPQLGDITEQWTKAKLRRGYEFIVGVDWQKHPFIVATFWKLYGSMEEPILWCCGELTVQGAEDDFLDELEDNGFVLRETPRQVQEVTSSNIVFVGDASGCWQSADHKGSPSYQVFKKRGFNVLPCQPKVGTSGRAPKNPNLGPSYGLCNWLLERDRIRIAPVAKIMGTACKEAVARPTRYGGAMADEPHCHPIDTMRYVSWWVCPPTRRAAAPGAAAGRARALEA